MKKNKTKYIICDVCSGSMGEGIALNSAIRDGSLGMYAPATVENLRFI